MPDVTDQEADELTTGLRKQADQWRERLSDPTVRQMVASGVMVIDPLVHGLLKAFPAKAEQRPVRHARAEIVKPDPVADRLDKLAETVQALARQQPNITVNISPQPVYVTANVAPSHTQNVFQMPAPERIVVPPAQVIVEVEPQEMRVEFEHGKEGKLTAADIKPADKKDED